MITASDPLSLDRFRSAIARRFGLDFDDTKSEFLSEVLQRRLDRTGALVPVYLDRLEQIAAPSGGELRELARELTVGETYFFRNSDQFRAVTEVVLPARIAVRSTFRSLGFLSAGCASGEEAYSLAMLVRDHLPDPYWSASILGVDVNPVAIEKARAATYSTWSLRETPPEAQRRWFHGRGREVVLDASIRDAVRFEERNLTEDDTSVWRPEVYDVVFCRNVLMYFTTAGAQAVMARITRSLAPGGYLFLGHAETLRGLSHDYHLCHTHGTFYYQRKSVLQADAVAPLDGAGARANGLEGGGPPPEVYSAVADSSWGGTWIDTIQRATDRIAELTRDPVRRASAASSEAAAVARRLVPDLSFALDLLKKERFSDALDRLAELPSDSAGDPDALLLRAALLTHRGQLDAARAACDELLARDELNAGAHYLLALCREGAGDREGAVEHDQTAAYLDPTFAMPRLHMGMLARRAGDHETARRELGQAMPLLAREDASRLLLFGGGFTREALAALCAVELGAAGAKR